MSYVVKHEAWLRSDDHVERVVAALIRDEVRFAVRPERDGWWKVNAWIRTADSSLDPKPLDQIVQATR